MSYVMLSKPRLRDCKLAYQIGYCTLQGMIYLRSYLSSFDQERVKPFTMAFQDDKISFSKSEELQEFYPDCNSSRK